MTHRDDGITLVDLGISGGRRLVRWCKRRLVLWIARWLLWESRRVPVKPLGHSAARRRSHAAAMAGIYLNGLAHYWAEDARTE